jgi:hypothetical protein
MVHPFVSGHPSKYWLCSMLLNYRDRGNGCFQHCIWPLAQYTYKYSGNFLKIILFSFQQIFKVPKNGVCLCTILTGRHVCTGRVVNDFLKKVSENQKNYFKIEKLFNLKNILKLKLKLKIKKLSKIFKIFEPIVVLNIFFEFRTPF